MSRIQVEGLDIAVPKDSPIDESAFPIRPLWPSGVIGGLTHFKGIRAIPAALHSNDWALGIDAEHQDRLHVKFQWVVYSIRTEEAVRDEQAVTLESEWTITRMPRARQ
jgi:4'-phosphopantetheinyl transferase EntD